MIISFLKIRFKQFYREVSALGLFRVIFMTGFLGFLVYGFLAQTTTTPDVYYVSGFYLVLIAALHLNRKDKLFLKSHFENYKMIYGAEYLLLTSPLLICLIYNQQWLSVLGTFLLLFLIINLNDNLKLSRKSRNLNTRLQQWIPDDSFEWKGGIRKYLVFLVAVWIIAMGTSFFIASVPIAIFILGVLPSGFYQECEPLPMVLAFEMKTNQFLFHKIKLQTLLFSIIVIPLIILFIVFHPEVWYIAVGEYIILVTLQIYMIVTKYAFYKPNTKSPAASTFGSVGAIGAMIPVFLPLVWVLGVWFYVKSFKNLNLYLHDYD